MKRKQTAFEFLTIISIIALFFIMGMFEQDNISDKTFFLAIIVDFAVMVISAKKAGLMNNE